MEGLQNVKNVQHFEEILGKSGRNLMVCHFWAPWAPQCEQMNDVLTELCKDPILVNTTFLKIEAEDIPELSHKYNVAAVPTFVFFKLSKEIDRLDGANAPVLTQKVKEHASLSAGVAAEPPPAQAKTTEDINSRLKKLITRSPVMLFMKGNPEEPKCGFSRTIVGLLKEQNVKFDTFDILQDQEVRQGLKTFSDWPTYPQLYSNGELLGGLDIVKELIESGELKSMLPTQEDLNSRLKSLIKQSPVMLFMKGSPDEPRCGFSKTIIQILKDHHVKFGHFDILQDQEVRQGLKTFSDWPTYPQLYANGELLGGLDIVKEMVENGELVENLPSQT